MATIKQIIKRTISRWRKEHTTDIIEQDVWDILNKKKETLIAQAVGFDCRWHGGWEIKNTYAKTEIEKLIIALAKRQAQVWLDEGLGDLPKLTKSAKNNLVTHYKSSLKNNLERKLRVIAEQKADEIATDLVEEYTEEFELETSLAKKKESEWE